MSMSAGISSGSFTPASAISGFNGITNTEGFGASRQYRDGVFIKSVFLKELSIKQRMNELIILMGMEKLPQVTAKKGQRYLLPTATAPAVGDVSTGYTTSSWSYPDYVATNDPTYTTSDPFTKIVGAGTSVLGIPVPLQRINEGEVELRIDQHRGLAMSFTKEFLEISLLENPSQYYAELIKYAMNNDMERYAWLVALYTGPLTEVASDFDQASSAVVNSDAIGITNATNYLLTRTLTDVGGASNLVTATTTGTMAGMSNPTKSRFGATPRNVPFLLGSTASDISYTTIARLSEKFDQYNVPLKGRTLKVDAKGYNDISHLPQFVNTQTAGSGGASDVNTTARIKGTIHGFDVAMTNVIQPAGASSNVLYELAMGPDAMCYGVQREPSLAIDNMLDKKEQALVLMSTARYGVVGKRPDHMAVVQTRTRV